MSTTTQQAGAGGREVAYRVFAAEYGDADLEHADSDEDRAPNYVVTPTGARVNRVFVVGVLTEVESVSEEVLRARIADPTGTFVLYAGQYQPDAQTFLERADPPAFVAVTGKARTFQPDGSDQIFTSIRPESINEVDESTRDRWIVQAAEHTCDRVEVFAAALAAGERGNQLTELLVEAGVDYGLATGIPLAIEHYGTTQRYLGRVYQMAIQAAEMVAGERDDVDRLDIGPGETGESPVAIPPAVDLEPASQPEVDAAGPSEGDASDTAPGSPEESGTVSTPDQEAAIGESSSHSAAESGPSEQEPAPVDSEPTADASGPDSDDLYELDDDERQQVESEYGTEFNTGNEIDGPSDLESAPTSGGDVDSRETQAEAHPEPDDETAMGDPAESSGAGEEQQSEEITSSKSDDSGGGMEAEAADSNTATDDDVLDLEKIVVEVMRDQDAGDGVSKTTVIETVGDEYDVQHVDIESAIEDALMSGKCYEPEENTFKAI